VAFVDTSAHFAVIDRRDAHHDTAVVISTRLTQQRWRLFTTNYILAETHALLLTRLDRATALTFLQEIGPTTIRAATADEQRAREIIERYTDKDFSLADAISFSVMERLNIRYAFTFDQHFAQYGFTVLTPEIV
jgi:predicted nucleic acid-binding protein